MKSYRTLALRELSAQKVTSFLILIAVILSTMMTAAVGQSAGVLAAMREQQAIALGGNRYSTFVQLTEEQAQALEGDSRLSYTGRYIPLGTMKLNDILSLSLTEYWDDPTIIQPSYSRVREGRLPQAPMEIALPEDALQFLGLSGKIGDTVSLPLSKALRHGIEAIGYEYTGEFTLVGITESNFLGYTTGNILGLAGKGTAEQVLPQSHLYYNVDMKMVDKGSFQVVMDELYESLNIHPLDSLYNIPYLNAAGIRYSDEAADSDMTLDDDGFSYLLLVGVLTVALILLAAGLVIYNILKIAVSQRIRQYGALRAIGAERNQLYTVVTVEVLLLCVVGIPLGLALGLLSARGILTAALNQLPPEIFLTPDLGQLQELIAANSAGKWTYLLLSAIITLLFAFLAAAPAARYAARVSPVAAMSGTRFKIKRKNRRSGKTGSFERYYARLNLNRNKGRTAITVLSLVMSITVFITLQGVISLLSMSGAVPEHLGDYSVVNQAGGISPEEVSSLEETEVVEAVAAMQHSKYPLDEQYYPVGVETDFPLEEGETFQIFGLNDRWSDYELSDWLTEEQLMAFQAGEGCVVRNPIPLTYEGTEMFTNRIEAGTVLTIAGKTMPVLLAWERYDPYLSVGNAGFANGIEIIVSDKIYSALTGSDSYAELRPILAVGANREDFDGVLDQLCQRIPGTTTVSYEQTDQQLRESEAQIKLLGWGLILFIGLIGILNIVNTVYTNIHTRIGEIGVQRAIGMSLESLYKTFLWEGGYYGLIAAAIGCTTGYLCSVLVGAAAAGELSLTAPPLAAMAESAGLSVLACLAATAIPLRKAAKLSIVDSIETVE